MITGLIPIICLWTTVICAALMLADRLGTRFWETPVGWYLLAFVAVTLTWWGFVLVGSYVGVPRWLEIAEGTAFIFNTLVIMWCAVLMLWGRIRGWLAGSGKRHKATARG